MLCKFVWVCDTPDSCRSCCSLSLLQRFHTHAACTAMQHHMTHFASAVRDASTVLVVCMRGCKNPLPCRRLHGHVPRSP
jgi:hypothetical protein